MFSVLKYLYILVCCALLLLCTEERNPFVTENTEMRGEYTLAFGDTTELLSTDTLVFTPLVHEHIDSFYLRTTGNTHFAETLLISPETSSKEFLVAFYDTGNQVISRTTFLSNGSIQRESLSVYVTSPLNQNDMDNRSSEGNAILRTPPVDDDAYYIWSFGNRRTVVSDTNSVTLPINISGSGIGELRVKSLNGFYTPAATFSYSFVDTTPPAIRLDTTDPPGTVSSNGDTLITGDTVIPFGVIITEQNEAGLLSEKIDNKDFDYSEGSSYYKIFRMSPDTGTLRLSVFAEDFSGNASYRNFYVKHNDSISSGNKMVSLTVVTPNEFQCTTNTANRVVAGFVKNFNQSRIYTGLSVNGDTSGYSLFDAEGEFKSTWGWNVSLESGENEIKVSVYNSTDSLLTDTICSLYLDTHAIDTADPDIYDVYLPDWTRADGSIIDTPVIELTVYAFDMMSGVDSVFINGTECVRDSEDRKFSYSADITLNHILGGNRVVIKAVDNAGNQSYDTINIAYNHIPEIFGNDTALITLIENSPDSGEIIYDDSEDKDTVKYDIIYSPDGMEVTNTHVYSGSIKWKWMPGAEDVGYDSLRVKVYDGYGGAVFFTRRFRVLDSASYHKDLEFAVDESDFIDAVYAMDTVKTTLSVKEGSGTPPYTYNIYKDRIDCSQYLEERSEFLWVPELNDTGYNNFTIEVVDSFSRRDTIFPSVFVVDPADEILVEFDTSAFPDTIPRGEISSLSVYISSEGNASKISFQVGVSSGSIYKTWDVSSEDSFTVRIDPSDIKSERDTVTVDILLSTGKDTSFEHSFAVGNYVPEIKDLNDLSIPEDSIAVITKDLMDVYDFDDTAFSFISESGDNYTLRGDTICPDTGFFGTLSVPIRVTDGKDTTDPQDLIVTVTEVNFIPEITFTQYPGLDSVITNDTLILNFTADDADADESFQYSVVINGDTIHTGTEPGDVSVEKTDLMPSASYTCSLSVSDADTTVVEGFYFETGVVIEILSESSGMTEDVYDFPVYIDLTGTEEDFGSLDTLNFVKHDRTELFYERAYNSGTFDSSYWVLVDTVFHNRNTEIVMQWGIDHGLDSSEAVFDTSNGFGAVLHFDDECVAGDIVDATGNRFSVYEIDDSAVFKRDNGLLNGNYYFESNSRVALDYQEALYSDRYSFSVWIRLILPPEDWGDSPQPRLWTRESNVGNHTVFETTLDNSLGSGGQVSLRYRSLNNVHKSDTGCVSNELNLWQHVFVTAGPDSVMFYIDGERCGAEELDTPWEYPGNENNPYIGNDTTGQRPFYGFMDELRFSTGTVRSESWIKLSYENQLSPSDLINIDY